MGGVGAVLSVKGQFEHRTHTLVSASLVLSELFVTTLQAGYFLCESRTCAEKQSCLERLKAAKEVELWHSGEGKGARVVSFHRTLALVGLLVDGVR